MTNGPLYDQWIGDVIPASGSHITIGRHQQDPGAAVVPMGEVHTDLEVVHNTSHFSAPASGVVRYNAAETRLELGPSQSGWQPIVTAVLFDAYDNTGGLVTTASKQTLTIDTVRINTHPEIFVLANNELQINMSGVYQFNLRFTVDTTQGTRITHVSVVRRQVPGGAFADITGSIAWTYTRNTATLGCSGSSMVIVPDVGVGDKFIITVQQAGTSIANVTTKADATSLTVQKLA